MPGLHESIEGWENFDKILTIIVSIQAGFFFMRRSMDDSCMMSKPGRFAYVPLASC